MMKCGLLVISFVAIAALSSVCNADVNEQTRCRRCFKGPGKRIKCVPLGCRPGSKLMDMIEATSKQSENDLEAEEMLALDSNRHTEEKSMVDVMLQYYNDQVNQQVACTECKVVLGTAECKPQGCAPDEAMQSYLDKTIREMMNDMNQPEFLEAVSQYMREKEAREQRTLQTQKLSSNKMLEAIQDMLDEEANEEMRGHRFPKDKGGPRRPAMRAEISEWLDEEVNEEQRNLPHPDNMFAEINEWLDEEVNEEQKPPAMLAEINGEPVCQYCSDKGCFPSGCKRRCIICRLFMGAPHCSPEGCIPVELCEYCPYVGPRGGIGPECIPPGCTPKCRSCKLVLGIPHCVPEGCIDVEHQ